MVNFTSHADEYSPGEIDSYLESTHNHLEEVLQESKEIVKLDEEAIQDFHEGMELFEKNRSLISAFANINQEELKEAIQEEGGHNKASQIIEQAEERAGYHGGLSPEAVKEVERSIEMIEENIKEAHEVLERANNLIKKEYDEDVDIEEALEKFESSFIFQLKGAIKAYEMAYQQELEDAEAPEDGKWGAE
jgi:hypothetical protein